MRYIGGRAIGLISANRIDGPWPCEQCGQLSQFAECTTDINRIFCKNEYCRFKRLVDKRKCTIVEGDGSMWRFNPATGKKWRIQ